MIGLSRIRFRFYVLIRGLARLNRVFILVGIAALGIMAIWIHYGIVFNYTHSAPFGLYREISLPASTPHNPAPYVFFCPDRRWPSMKGQPNFRDPMRTCPDGYSPFIKPVVAWPGDTVETSAAGIVVNGRPLPNTSTMDHDSTGHKIHPFPAGQYIVQQGELWVVSSFSPRSFDSRYFGPIPLKSVRSWIRPLLVERSYHPAGNLN
jgi:conjugative transfer signal peptidase TraF